MSAVSSCTVYTELCSDCNHCKHSTFVPKLGICLGVGVATLVALGVCREGISVDGRCCGGCCSNGSEVSMSLLLGLLVLLAP